MKFNAISQRTVCTLYSNKRQFALDIRDVRVYKFGRASSNFGRI